MIFAMTGCAASQVQAGAQTEPVNDIDRAAESPLENSATELQAPESQTAQTLNFLFFSDTQADPDTMDYSEFGELFKGALRRNDAADIIIYGGDTVNDGGNETEWLNFIQEAGPVLGRVTTAAVVGNHDNYALITEQFDHPSEAPGNPGDGYFYSFKMGAVFFIMLDSNIMGAANQSDIDWLRSELQGTQARQADWRIAVMHHPMWPAADIPKDIQRAETMRGSFLPIMEENGVDLILCGHQHIYARTLPMSGESAVSDGNGIIQIMAASGGKASYPAGAADYIAAGDSAPNYISLAASCDSITVTAYSGMHIEIDSVTLRK